MFDGDGGWSTSFTPPSLDERDAHAVNYDNKELKSSLKRKSYGSYNRSSRKRDNNNNRNDRNGKRQRRRNGNRNDNASASSTNNKSNKKTSHADASFQAMLASVPVKSNTKK